MLPCIYSVSPSCKAYKAVCTRILLDYLYKAGGMRGTIDTVIYMVQNMVWNCMIWYLMVWHGIKVERFDLVSTWCSAGRFDITISNPRAGGWKIYGREGSRP